MSSDSGYAPPQESGAPREETSMSSGDNSMSRGDSRPPRDDRQQGPRDTVYIGKKPVMAYVTSTLLMLAEITSITIKARGMSISRAVDVAQIVSRKQDNSGYTIGDIELDSEPMETNDGRQRNVSTISITIKRN